MNAEFIEKFFNGQLSVSEKDSFEKRLISDTAFKKEVEDYKLILDGFSHLHFIETKSKIKSLDPELKLKSPKAKIRSIGKWRAAATVALIVIGGMGIYSYLEYNVKGIVLANYETPMLNQRRSTDVADMNMDELITAFNEKRYTDVISLLQIPLDNNEIDPHTKFILANAYFQTEYFDKSIKHCQEIMQSSSKRYYYPAEWLEVLCNLKLNEVTSASKTLESIKNNKEHPYSNRAKKLYKKIRNPLYKIVNLL